MTGIAAGFIPLQFPRHIGGEASVQQVVIQIPAVALKMPAASCQEAFEQSPAFRAAVLRYLAALLDLGAQTAACNRLHDIAERLARWLLMCHDRMESDSFYITHEFLGHMLGTPRSTVTLAQPSGPLVLRLQPAQRRSIP